MIKENQIESNPFPYSNTNKRYHTFSFAFKKKYGVKCAKIPLDAGFTCPNRDGLKGTGGCLFCSSRGSGDTILEHRQSLSVQFEKNLERARLKWPDALGIPYFQAYSNTYGSLDDLKTVYQPFLDDPDIPCIAIATRSDCLDEETVRWLAGYPKEIWIELGLQTVHEKTARKMNLGHSLSDAIEAVSLCRRYGLKTCLHLINGLPGETEAMMMETASQVAKIHPDAVKIHMLHVLESSALGKIYAKKPFPLLSMEQYAGIVCRQLEILPEEIIIERVGGDALQSDLAAPQWIARKTELANLIDRMLYEQNSWQGKFFYPFSEDPVLLKTMDKDGWSASFYHGLPYEAMRLRADVFLKEQKFTMEFDETDVQAVHVLLEKNAKTVGVLRLFAEKNQPDTWLIGRVAISQAVRGEHAGSRLLEFAREYIKEQGGRTILLHAQERVIPFYEKNGWTAFGKADYDEHVLHRWMKSELI